VISLNNVSKEYFPKREASVVAVKDVSLEVEAGEFVVVTGRSGSGKTTLLNLIAGLAKPTKGTVMVNGVNLWEKSDTERARLRNQKLGFVFQFPSLLQSLTVLENIVLPLGFFSGGASQKDLDKARQLLEVVGLSDKLNAGPRQLSAGQQQRVVIARALINSPSVLLADEPTSNLDEQTEVEIISLLMDIYRQNGITLVLVTHDGSLVKRGTRSIVMSSGQIVSDTKSIDLSPLPVSAALLQSSDPILGTTHKPIY
jgi:ABC-type lipoprotein export system ATPase subunit